MKASVYIAGCFAPVVGGFIAFSRVLPIGASKLALTFGWIICWASVVSFVHNAWKAHQRYNPQIVAKRYSLRLLIPLYNIFWYRKTLRHWVNHYDDFCDDALHVQKHRISTSWMRAEFGLVLLTALFFLMATVSVVTPDPEGHHVTERTDLIGTMLAFSAIIFPLLVVAHIVVILHICKAANSMHPTLPEARLD